MGPMRASPLRARHDMESSHEDRDAVGRVIWSRGWGRMHENLSQGETLVHLSRNRMLLHAGSDSEYWPKHVL